MCDLTRVCGRAESYRDLKCPGFAQGQNRSERTEWAREQSRVSEVNSLAVWVVVLEQTEECSISSSATLQSNSRPPPPMS